MLKFEDFTKLEIRIGTVLEAERVPETDRLIRVVVDMGNEKRQVVAGFGHKHEPEELIGKQVPIVLNIEKATFLVPQESIPNGSKVK